MKQSEIHDLCNVPCVLASALLSYARKEMKELKKQRISVELPTFIRMVIFR